VLKTLGADIIRLWVAATDYRNEMSVSEQILKRTADAYRRIRNTARFLLANLNGFDPARNLVEPSQMIELDRWAVDRTLELQEQIISAYRDYQFHLIYQKIQNFCTKEMGGFYLDIIKDRQYTTQADSLARRSCQTAMYHIVEAVTRWLAPILSFTADEIWREIPGQRGHSVFLASWYEGLFPLDTDDRFNRDLWRKVINVRDAVGQAMEKFRAEGNSSLDAEVDIYCTDSFKEPLDRLEDELRFVLITSDAKLYDIDDKPDDATLAAKGTLATHVFAGEGGLTILIKASHHEKCIRCWHHRADVGADAAHPELCGRCVENVVGSGEHRRFA
jgi:isoleucyl-tRNA synthetase